jgi:hypothetical protein
MAANTPRSSTKRSTSTKRKTTARKPAAKSTTRTTSSRSRNGTKPSSSRTRASSGSSRSSANNNGNGVVDTVKGAAGKAAAPAAAIGAAAIGIAGGIALKARTRRKTVLGVKMPRKGISDIDPKSIAKTVGQASKRFAKTTKGVSKDLERAGDQAERIGKILD